MQANTIPLAVAAAFLLYAIAPGGAQAAERVAADYVQVHIDCDAPGVTCPPPPAPPRPPRPPAPPRPPVKDVDERGVPPALPDIPAPPAVPAVPPVPEPVLPEVPAAAHAACAGKLDGSSLTWKLGAHETMQGVCTRQDGKMAFRLRKYEVHK